MYVCFCFVYLLRKEERKKERRKEKKEDVLNVGVWEFMTRSL